MGNVITTGEIPPDGPDDDGWDKTQGNTFNTANWYPPLPNKPAEVVKPKSDSVAQPLVEKVNHPSHYGGADNVYEAIKVIENWGLGFCTGNVVKYISRAGKKDPKALIEDLEKARWYLDREISRLKGNK